MTFSIDFIASLLSSRISHDELTFKSIEKIRRSDYKLYMKNVGQKSIFNSKKELLS